MLFALGSALILITLLAVRATGRAVNRPATPEWLRRAALGNAMALLATLVFAVGMSLLLQAAFLHGGMAGLLLAIVGFVAPLLGFWLIARVLDRREAPRTDAGPASTGSTRRARTDPRPAPSMGRAAGLRRAG